MDFLVVVLLGLQFTSTIVLSQACKNMQNVPVDVNEDYDDTRYFKGCIDNASFASNEVVKSLNIDCLGNGAKALEELPKNFLSNLENLSELAINKCFVKSVTPEAFINLPILKKLDLSGNVIRRISARSFSSTPSLMYLNLSNNAIAFIDDFSFAALPRLADIDLSFNKLDFMKRVWFGDTTTVEEFYINNNNLKEIPEKMFSGWRTTYAFNFDYNEIATIHNGAFTDVSSEINYLSLHHNQLSVLNLNGFSKTSILQLDISSNLLNYLPLEFFKRIRVKQIWIFGNPFECTCLRATETALETRRVEIKGVESNLPEANNEKCHRFDIPSCVATTALLSNSCNETQDVELTNRITSHMKKLGFTDLRDWYEQCAVVLSRKTYLET